MTNKTLAILNRSTPFGAANAKESLDVALIMGSYEHPVYLYFQGEAIWQLVDKQKPELISAKNFLKTFAALEFYDIDTIYVNETSMEQLGFTTTDLHVDNVTLLSDAQFSHSLKQHKTILVF